MTFSRRFLLVCTIIVGLGIEVLLSLIILLPGFWDNIKISYFLYRYPFIPKSEYATEGKAYRLNSDGTEEFESNGRKIYAEGTKILVTKPTGDKVEMYMGTVVRADRSVWERELGAEGGAYIPRDGLAIDLTNRRISIVRNEDIKIVAIPQNAIFQRHILYLRNGRVVNMKEESASLADIQEGDSVQIVIGSQYHVTLTRVIKTDA